MWLVARALPELHFAFPARPLVASAVALIGLAITIVGVVQFRAAGTTVNPMQPSGSSALVTDRVYGLTRNPMYLGFAFALLGWGIFLAHPIALALVAGFVAYMTRFQIIPEERAMRSLFGSAFDAYRARVRRWI